MAPILFVHNEVRFRSQLRQALNESRNVQDGEGKQYDKNAAGAGAGAGAAEGSVIAGFPEVPGLAEVLAQAGCKKKAPSDMGGSAHEREELDADDSEAQALARLACAQAEQVVHDSMAAYKRQFPCHSFEKFLEKEWPEDYQVLLKTRSGDPAFTRTYDEWIHQYAEITTLTELAGGLDGGCVQAEGTEQREAGQREEEHLHSCLHGGGGDGKGQTECPAAGASVSASAWDMQAMGRALSQSQALMPGNYPAQELPLPLPLQPEVPAIGADAAPPVPVPAPTQTIGLEQPQPCSANDDSRIGNSNNLARLPTVLNAWLHGAGAGAADASAPEQDQAQREQEERELRAALAASLAEQ
jgi:hypothetical protein